MSDEKRKKRPTELEDKDLEKAQGGGFASIGSPTVFNTATGFNTADAFNTASGLNTADGGLALNDSPLKR